MITEKQKAMNTLTASMNFFKTAETKKEADRYYALVKDSLENYYNTVWGSEEK